MANNKNTKHVVRTSVMLAEAQYAQLAALAADHDLSVAWFIRQAVQEYLERTKQPQRALPVAIRRSEGG